MSLARTSARALHERIRHVKPTRFRKGTHVDHVASWRPGRRLSRSGLFRDPDLVVTCATRTRVKKKKNSTPNKLAEEHSPDLLSYANDLVKWYPWGEEAFQKAEEEDKLIYLCIGYSTCRYCRIMQEESFQNSKVAEFINKNFIPVKVDREERLDVDRLYATFVQESIGYCGWPLNVILTPELEPVYGAAYLPTPTKGDAISLQEALQSVLDGWQNSKDTAIAEGNNNMRILQKLSIREPVLFDEDRPDGTTLVDDLMDNCANVLMENFDERYGGFLTGGKFPKPSSLKMLMRQFVRQSGIATDQSLGFLLKMLLYTFGAMRDGGLHDHIGGGFHRYTYDRIWHIPHFEKLLIDNAQLAQCYLSFGLLLPEEDWFMIARGALDYLVRELRSPDGAFYSGQDADSHSDLAKGLAEGAYYVWEAEEIRDVLDKEEYGVFADYYSIFDAGNCNLAKLEGEKDRFTNCLFVQVRDSEVAEKHKMEVEDLLSMLNNCRKKLFERRSKRPAPKLDDKIVCGYNGMAISAFAEAGRILQFEPNKPTADMFPVASRDPQDYLSIAREVAEFIKQNMWDEEERILKRFYKNGNVSQHAFADDYAHVIAGLLDLYTCTAELKWLQWAMQLQDRMDELFWDSVHGGYFITTEESQSSPFRMKFGYDTEEPSASSVALSNLLRLSGMIEENEAYDQRAKETMAAFGSEFMESATMFAELAASAYLADMHPNFFRIVIVGDLKSDEVEEYLNAMHASYAPSKCLIAIDPSDEQNVEFWNENGEQLTYKLTDYIRTESLTKKKKKKKSTATGDRVQVRNKSKKQLPAVFVCQNFDCAGPFESPDELIAFMKSDEEDPKTERLDMQEIFGIEEGDEDAETALQGTAGVPWVEDV